MIQLKLAILTREDISFDTRLREKPKQVNLPREPKFEEPMANTTEESEQDRQTKNSLNKPQGVTNFQIWLKCLCSERPRTMCYQKCVSLLYLITGTEGR